MKRIHRITLVAASAAFLGSGVALAQTVSGSDPYAQGYAAGAAAQHKNNFNAYDSGYQASEAQQAANAQAYNNGYEAGLTQGKTATKQAYNSGYQDRAVQETDANNRAFDNGFRRGAEEQARN